MWLGSNGWRMSMARGGGADNAAVEVPTRAARGGAAYNAVVAVPTRAALK
jgi:hypothetical protein